MNKLNIKWRSWFKGQPPRLTKLEIPGWAGNSHSHTNGDKPQPWYCVPWIEGSTYGLELVYPFNSECQVVNRNGKAEFIGDFTEEEKSTGVPMPPFISFAPGHYGFTSSLDIQTDPEYITRLETHPRFYTDDTGTVPLAVPGHLQSAWWPRVFFVVFKTPFPGQTHIFRKNEPYAQILILPQKVQYNIQEMTAEEKEERAIMDKTIADLGNKYVAKHPWKDYLGNSFDDKYKVLASAYASQGVEGVKQVLAKAQHKAQPKSTFKIKRRLIHETKKNHQNE